MKKKIKRIIFSLAVVGIFCLLGVFSTLHADVTINNQVPGSGMINPNVTPNDKVPGSGMIVPGSSTAATPNITTVNPNSASGPYKNQEKIPGAEPTNDFITYLKSIINFGFAIIGILALFMLIIGAYQYLMAAGSGNASDAKDTITSALLGLVLGLTAWIILNTINPDLVSFRNILQIQGTGGTPGAGGVGGKTTDLSSVTGTVPSDLKDRIAKYDPLVQKYSAQYNVNPNEIRAIIEQESNWRPDAQRGTADYGMMQINRVSHPAFFANNNPLDAEANMAYGVKYYASLRQNTDVYTAMARYNNGGKGEATAKGQNYADATMIKLQQYNNSGYK